MKNPLIFVFFSVISGTLCASAKSLPESNFEAAITAMKRKIITLEAKVQSLESIETPVLIEKVKDELTARVEEMHTESKSRNNEFSAKLEEQLQKTMDTDKKLSGVETELELVSGRLQKETDRFLVMNNHLLKELMQVQKKSDETLEKVRRVEDYVKNTSEMERSKMEKLEVKGNLTRILITSHIVSQQDVDEEIRQNVTTSVENLRQHMNESLLGIENEHSIFKRKMSNLGSWISKLEKENANASSNVSKLDEDLQNLDNTMTARLLSIRNEVENLERKGDLRDAEASEIKAILKNHTSDISALDKQLFDIQNSCGDDVPSLQNGKVMDFERKHGSSILYECDRNFVMTGDSTVRCEFGKWEGHPPVCTFFDATFYAEAYNTHPKYYIECHSDSNADEISFSRAVDTGSGQSPSKDARQRYSEKSVQMDLSRVSYASRPGVYRCGFTAEEGSAAIFVPYQPYDFLQFPDPMIVVNVGDSVTLRVHSNYASRRILWSRDGSSVPFWDGRQQVVIEGATADDEGTYGARYEGDKSNAALLRLDVKRCKAGVYGERCDKPCPPCHNGGICHDLLGVCVCPEGFVGRNCETPCPQGFHGADCTKPCTDGDCKGRLYCKSDPFGCSCGRGFKGTWCKEECGPGWYGAGCKQPCHCAEYGDCNRFTGACSGGCASGWTGQSCQIEDAE